MRINKNYLVVIYIFIYFNITSQVMDGSKNEPGTLSIKEYFLPNDTLELIKRGIEIPDLFFVGKDEICFSSNSKFRTIPRADKRNVKLFASDGKYFICSYEVERGYVWKPALSFGKVSDKSKNIIGTLDLSISHEPQSIVFIQPGKALVTTIMEYAVIDFIYDAEGDTIKFNISYHSLPDGLLYDNFIVADNQNPNFMLLCSGYSLYYLNKAGESIIEPLLSIHDLNLPDEKFSSSKPILQPKFLDSNKVVLKYNGKLILLNLDDHKIDEISIRDSIKLESGLIFGCNEIEKIFIKNMELFLVLKNRDIIKVSIDFANNWEYTAKKLWSLPILKRFGEVRMLDSANFLIRPLGFRSIILVSKNRTISNNKTENASAYISAEFVRGNISVTGDTYGVSIINFSSDINEVSETVYWVDVTSTNKLLLTMSNWQDYASEKGLASVNQTNIDMGNSSIPEIASVAGDLDEDGDEDIIVSSLEGPPEIFENNGDGYFRTTTNDFNIINESGRSESVVLGDINNDGYLDIFLTSFLKSNILYINDKKGGFYNGTEVSNLNSNGTSVSACFGDINNDGWLDIYVGNWASQNLMYLNKGDGTFKDISLESGTQCDSLKKTNSVLFADFDNDGRLDLFVGNRGGNNRLFKNMGDGKFIDISVSSRIGQKFFTYGAVAGDFNNDGWLDLYINGLSGICLYQNNGKNGNIYFENITQVISNIFPLEEGYYTGAAAFDYEHDGDLDIVAGQFKGQLLFLENITTGINKNKLNNFFLVKVVGAKTNRSGIGAQLKLFKDDTLIAYREINAGSGYASSNSKIQHFGLRSLAGSYIIEVKFPASGLVKRIPVIPGESIVVNEYDGAIRYYYWLKKIIYKWLSMTNIISAISQFIILIVLITLIRYLFSKSGNVFNMRNLSLFMKHELDFGSFILVIIFNYIIYFGVLFAQNKILSVNYWVSGSDFTIWNMIIALVVTSIFAVIFFKNQSDKYFNTVAKEQIENKLLLNLKQFNHGGGALNILISLSLFIKNSHEFGNYENDKKEIIINRFNEIKKDLNDKVILEIENIAKLIKIISKSGGSQYQSFKNLGISIHNNLLLIKEKVNLLDYSIIGKKNYIETSLGKSNQEIVKAISTIKEDFVSIKKYFESKFSCLVNEVIEKIKTKYNYAEFDFIKFINKNKLNNTAIYFKYNELEEIICLIIQNAIEELEFSKPSKRILNIIIANTDSSIIIEIEDNGRGINEKVIDLVFDLNFSTKGDNHGFGLAYAKQEIEKYGGSIDYEQSKYNGALFTITLNIIS